MNEQFKQGQVRLAEVANRYASQHGLQPETVEWVDQGYEWWLRLSTSQHTVRVVFSRDEIEAFSDGSDDSRETKIKIRNAFASLAM
ncbi:MAG: hypothetical protein C0618_04250 [Desulfuromonas sp.]|nr:MAG: hypothetical protein C0618_04250 [Desulfuromonas sp.]